MFWLKLRLLRKLSMFCLLRNMFSEDSLSKGDIIDVWPRSSEKYTDDLLMLYGRITEHRSLSA